MTDAPSPAPKRRRSAYISTLLIGGAAAMALSACDGGDTVEQTQAQIFPTIEACKVEFSAEECDLAFEQSRQLHQQNAPQFTDQAACEAQMGAGACQQTVVTQPNGSVSSVFMPALMGFMLARALQPGGPSYYPRPIYVDRDGYMRSGNANVGQVPGGREAFRNSTRSTTVTTPVNRSGQVAQPSRSTNRGGFGSSSRGFSGGG